MKHWLLSGSSATANKLQTAKEKRAVKSLNTQQMKNERHKKTHSIITLVENLLKFKQKNLEKCWGNVSAAAWLLD